MPKVLIDGVSTLSENLFLVCSCLSRRRAVVSRTGAETLTAAAFLGEESNSRHNVGAVLVQRRDYKGS